MQTWNKGFPVAAGSSAAAAGSSVTAGSCRVAAGPSSVV